MYRLAPGRSGGTPTRRRTEMRQTGVSPREDEYARRAWGAQAALRCAGNGVYRQAAPGAPWLGRQQPMETPGTHAV